MKYSAWYVLYRNFQYKFHVNAMLGPSLLCATYYFINYIVTLTFVHGVYIKLYGLCVYLLLQCSPRFQSKNGVLVLIIYDTLYHANRGGYACPVEYKTLPFNVCNRAQKARPIRRRSLLCTLFWLDECAVGLRNRILKTWPIRTSFRYNSIPWSDETSVPCRYKTVVLNMFLP